MAYVCGAIGISKASSNSSKNVWLGKENGFKVHYCLTKSLLLHSFFLLLVPRMLYTHSGKRKEYDERKLKKG